MECGFCYGSGYFQGQICNGCTEVDRKPHARETQIGGDHYTKMKIQPIEYSLANGLGPCEANVVKYISRHKSKGGAEDLKKAKHYIDLLLQHEYPEEKE